MFQPRHENLMLKLFENQNIKFQENDALKGGLADNQIDSKFDSEQLAKGIEVELEHTDDVETAKEIAKDHLKEDPRYYDKLAKMEKVEQKEELPYSLGRSSVDKSIERHQKKEKEKKSKSGEYPKISDYQLQKIKETVIGFVNSNKKLFEDKKITKENILNSLSSVLKNKK